MSGSRGRSASRLTRVAFLGLLPMASGGCGFVLVHGPPTQHEQVERLNCTEGNAGPILDVAMAGLGGLMAVWAANQVRFDDYFYYVHDELVATGVTAAALYGLSAYVGFRKAKKCRAATQQLAK